MFASKSVLGEEGGISYSQPEVTVATVFNIPLATTVGLVGITNRFQYEILKGWT